MNPKFPILFPKFCFESSIAPNKETFGTSTINRQFLNCCWANNGFDGGLVGKKGLNPRKAPKVTSCPCPWAGRGLEEHREGKETEPGSCSQYGSKATNPTQDLVSWDKHSWFWILPWD